MPPRIVALAYVTKMLNLRSTKSGGDALVKKWIWWSVIGVGLVVIVALFGIGAVVSLDDEGDVDAATSGFDPARYVNSIWDDKVVPTIAANAVEMADLLEELEKDELAACTEYGNQTAMGGAYSFMVKGTGKVIDVDENVLIIDVPSCSDNCSVGLRIGPPFTGTEIRDSVGFIEFGDFTNVLEYGAVAGELNTRVARRIGDNIDLEDIKGSTISFNGAFTLHGTGDIVVIPVTLEKDGTMFQ